MVRARGAARERVVEVAVELFAEHGVHGTSLQMIADRIGVGKAAVYYQFPSKDEIVLAALRPVFEDLAQLIARAELLPHNASRREVVIEGLVDLMVRQRNASFPFRRDRYIDHLVARHVELQATADRLHALPLGPDHDHATQVSLAVAITGIYYCATDSMLDDIPAPQLRILLLGYFKRCVLPASASRRRQRPAHRGQPRRNLV
ncbi:TetR/AcrR family transcriptional regulator [Mycolicibacterium sp. P9-22]|nr:TetR/AcrR family transcriptional regulator [Mycolicibacterium sp. P9-22]